MSSIRNTVATVSSTSVAFWNLVSMHFFQETFEALENTDILLEGYGIKPHEWRVDGYPAVQRTSIRNRGSKESDNLLLDDI